MRERIVEDRRSRVLSSPLERPTRLAALHLDRPPIISILEESDLLGLNPISSFRYSVRHPPLRHRLCSPKLTQRGQLEFLCCLGRQIPLSSIRSLVLLLPYFYSSTRHALLKWRHIVHELYIFPWRACHRAKRVI